MLMYCVHCIGACQGGLVDLSTDGTTGGTVDSRYRSDPESTKLLVPRNAGKGEIGECCEIDMVGGELWGRVNTQLQTGNVWSNVGGYGRYITRNRQLFLFWEEKEKNTPADSGWNRTVFLEGNTEFGWKCGLQGKWEVDFGRGPS